MKIAIALSGGVDSAVAAYEYMRLGYSCMGVTMQLPGGLTEGAKAIASQLNIPLHIFDAREDFMRAVVNPFAEGYINGGTPNPCIPCNKHIKFGTCAEFAFALGADYIATGHYARVQKENGRFLLKKARDENKDQSYYLYGLSQEQLKRILFPLGQLTKPEVREIARKQGFFNADKPESQDICFIPDGDYVGFIKNHTGHYPEPGNFIDPFGNACHRHKGHIHYTIGQRKGLGIAWHSPLYVKEKNISTNSVILCENDDLFTSTLDAVEYNWITPENPTEPFRAKARIRYRQKEQWATVTPTTATTARVVFDEPQRAIAKGQHVVIYDGDTVLGGGVIASSFAYGETTPNACHLQAASSGLARLLSGTS